ncbi:UNVERIFIED_CONTAM: hypothetical protein HDU68_004270 [Siphonaria sp. JEL0065]|nr:hypothetical protein HDU68_004270 [Siphonaria sp. JEL0065]
MSGLVYAKLLFYANDPIDGSLPYTFKVGNGKPVPSDLKPLNFECEWRQIAISDMRGKEGDFRLDECGFECVKNSGLSDDQRAELLEWLNDSSDYFDATLKPIAESVLSRSQVKFKSIHVFGSGKRNSRTLNSRFVPLPNASAPATRIHVDQSFEMGILRTQQVLAANNCPPYSPSSTRYRIINVWIPLCDVVRDWPLIFADSRTCPEESLVRVRAHVRGVPTDGENYTLKYTDGVEYYYWSQMKWSEALLVQCFDSQILEDGSRVRCPHGSFRDPRFVVDEENVNSFRVSVEIRCLVLSDVSNVSDDSGDSQA